MQYHSAGTLADIDLIKRKISPYSIPESFVGSLAVSYSLSDLTLAKWQCRCGRILSQGWCRIYFNVTDSSSLSHKIENWLSMYHTESSGLWWGFEAKSIKMTDCSANCYWVPLCCCSHKTKDYKWLVLIDSWDGPSQPDWVRSMAALHGSSVHLPWNIF